MPKNNVYILNGNIAQNPAVIPTVQFYLQEYHEDNSDNADQWNWFNILDLNFDQCDELYFQKHPPHIVGISVYVWNYKYLYQTAEQIKKKYPNCLIVAGGPQVAYKFEKDFWQTHSYIDYVVPNQGEASFSELLDNYLTNSVEHTSGIAYFKNNTLVETEISHKQKTKKWESQWVLRYKDKLQQEVDTRISNGINPQIIYETTRGCPYRCTYCDWGGGTYAKTKKKDIEVIKQELEILSKMKVYDIHLGDANFGMYKLDVEIAEHVAELKNTYNYPKFFYYDPSKNNVKNNMQITRIFAENNVSINGVLAFQDIDPEVLKHTDRLNADPEEQIAEALKLHKELGVLYTLHLIFGLPGQTVESMRKSIKRLTLLSNDIFYSRWNHLQILPNTPLATEPLKSKQKMTYDYYDTIYKNQQIKAKTKEDFEYLKSIGIYSSPHDVSDVSCLITGCNTFCKQDLSIIHFISNAVNSLATSGILDFFFDILDNDNDCVQLVDGIVENIDSKDREIYQCLQEVDCAHQRWFNKDQQFPDIDVHKSWPFTVSFYNAFDYYTFTNHEVAIDFIVDIAKEYLDRDFTHQAEWLKQTFISPDYYPGKKFYATNPFTGQTGNWRLTTKKVRNGEIEIPITWPFKQGEERLKDYFFQTCMSKNGSRIAEAKFIS